jgi:hypothetical protein
MLAFCGSLLNLASPTVLQALTDRIQLGGALTAFGILLIPALVLVVTTPDKYLKRTEE